MANPHTAETYLENRTCPWCGEPVEHTGSYHTSCLLERERIWDEETTPAPPTARQPETNQPQERR